MIAYSFSSTVQEMTADIRDHIQVPEEPQTASFTRNYDTQSQYIMNIERLPNLALIKISGEEAEGFLQGQLSNDVTKLLESWQLSGYCNPKGRLLALFYLWKHHGDFYALLSADLLETISKRLRMYTLRSKVSIETVQTATVFGVCANGDLAAEVLVKLGFERELLTSKSNQHGRVLCNQEHTCLVINNRYLLIDYKGLKLTVDKEQHPDSNWLAANIDEGLPQVTMQSSEQFLPQMLNLDVLGAINFKKGCYTGQEVVARLHYLGKLKQRMFVCDLSTQNSLPDWQINDKVYADADLQKVVGNIVSIDRNKLRALAVLRVDYSGKTLYLDLQTCLTVSKNQPYPLPQVA